MNSDMGGVSAWRRLFLVPATLFLVVAFGAMPASSSTCGLAHARLMQYVTQVNHIASYEQAVGIPQRCFGNMMCLQMQNNNLQFWYHQQAAFVNAQYYQLVRQCTGQQLPRSREPFDLDNSQEIEDLEIDDKDRAVRIRIPKTPQGYRP